MKHIIICTNLRRDPDLKISKRLAEKLREAGYSASFSPLFDINSEPLLPNDVSISEINENIEDAEMIITLGGDGTILKAARLSVGSGVPILGVNFGDKGFMAELEAGNIDLIPAAISGEYETAARTMLNVEIVRDNKVVLRDVALNDAVIRGTTRIVELLIYGDGDLISHFSGDGAVIATAIGSTAYSMSAGGPIVEPSAKNIIVTPICPHALVARSFVLDPDRRVTIEIGTKKINPVFISVDGGDSIDLRPGDMVDISRSSVETLLVHFKGRSFYNKVSEKLGERE